MFLQLLLNFRCVVAILWQCTHILSTTWYIAIPVLNTLSTAIVLLLTCFQQLLQELLACPSDATNLPQPYSNGACSDTLPPDYLLLFALWYLSTQTYYPDDMTRK